MTANLKNRPENKLTREDRVAAALRENLRKRKQQAQSRAPQDDTSKDEE